VLARLTALTLRRRGLACAVLAVVTLLAVLGIRRLESAVGYRSLLGERHPVVRELDAFVERFGGGLPLVAVWSCPESPCDGALDARSLRMAHAVARALEGVAGVRRVDSPATSPLVAPELFDLPRARRLAPDGTPVSDLAELAPVALADPLWVRQLVSEDGQAGAVLVHLAGSDSATSTRVHAALVAALAPWEREGFRFHLVGGPVEFVVAGGELERSTARIVPVMVALVALTLVVLFRSVTAAVLSLVTVGLAVLWTLGLAGWLGWPQTTLSQALAPLLLVVGVCHGIHFLARLAAEPPERERRDALRHVSAELASPCLMTSVTTAAGFGSLAVRGLESIARFGALAAIGVFAALVLTFTVLPLAVSMLPAPWLGRAAGSERWDALLGLTHLAASRPRAVAIVVALVVALAVVGLGRLRVDASFEDLYGRNSDVVRWAETVGRVLRAPDTLEIAVTPPRPDVPIGETLPVVARIAAALPALDGLGRPRSAVDLLDHLHRMLHGEPLPPGAAGADRAASMLRLARAEDPGAVALLLDDESGGARITVEAVKLPQERLRATLAAVDEAVAGALPPGWTATVTGPLAVVGAMIDELRTTQLWSFSLAAFVIFLVVTLFFRSPVLGFVAVVPTALPDLVTVGIMGLLGMPLDVGSAMVAAVVLGVAVDDAIHVLAVEQEGRAHGLAPAAAITDAYARTGRALITTSVALAAGFLTLTLSSWHSIASFGLVATVAIVLALVATLVVLPPLQLMAASLRLGSVRSG
jgi:hypothetical protein